MKVVIARGEEVEVGFEDSEEVFRVICFKNGKVLIRQTAGFEVFPWSKDKDYELDDIGIYPLLSKGKLT